MKDGNLAILYTEETREHTPCSLGERSEHAVFCMGGGDLQLFAWSSSSHA